MRKNEKGKDFIIKEKKKSRRKSSKKKNLKTEVEDDVMNESLTKKKLIKFFGGTEISKISKLTKRELSGFNRINKTLLSDSIKLNFDDSSTHINKIENYISNRKSNFLNKLNGKISKNEYMVNMNSNKIDSDLQSQRLARINSKIQKFVNN